MPIDMPYQNILKFFPRWLLEIAIIFFIVLILLTGAYFIFEKKYDGKIYPGVSIGNISLSGKTFNQAKEIINQGLDKINQDGFKIYYQNQTETIYPIVASLTGDIAYKLIETDVEKTSINAITFGRNNNFFLNTLNKLKALTFGKNIYLVSQIDENRIKEILKAKFSKFETPAENAALTISRTASSSLTFFYAVSQEKAGKVIEYNKALEKMRTQLISLNTATISLNTITDYPEIYKKDCINIQAKAQEIIDLAPITLLDGENSWVITQDELLPWLTLKDSPVKEKNLDKVIVGLDFSKIKTYLESQVAMKINLEPQDAKFNLANGRVIEFQASRDGRILQIDTNLEKIENELVVAKKNQIILVVNEEKSKINTANINEVGIKEIIGIGQSNFKGSPVNRRHNIKVGADSLNGLLIKPNEEFSLVKALGKIDGSTGYLPELVIKENKTTPEFGGGLCQIGTTMFRAALATGLPITARTNHSYRVVYYEPAGTDATIYDPKPDLKFINDTGSHILIQRRIEGDYLYFDFWGTTDNRIATQTKPVIYNITKPGPTKLVETLDLPVGQKKCTESAHNGADTYFDYKVTYASGEVKEKRFSSHYVPWRAVCLIGVEKLTETASSTPPIETPPPVQ